MKPHAPETSSRAGLAVLLLLLVAAAIRLFHLGAQSLWIDEFFTLQNLSLPLLDVPAAAIRINNAPPLYYLLVWPVQFLPGIPEWTLRLPSAAAGVLTVLLIYHLALRLFSDRHAALAAAALLAFNPLHLWFSQEARNYTFLLALQTGTCLAYLRAVERNRSREWWCLGLLIVASAATATQGVLALPVLVLWAILSPPPRPQWRPLAQCLAASGLLALAITVVVALQSGRPPPPRAFTGAEIPYTGFCFAAGYSFGPSFQELQTLPLKRAILGNVIQLALGGLLVALTGIAWLRISWRKAAPALAWLAGGIFFAIAIHFATPHSYHVRYALPALLGFVLLTALAVTQHRTWGPALLAAHLLLYGWSIVQWFTMPKYGKEDTRETIVQLLETAPALHSAQVAPPYMRDVVELYARRAGHPLSVVELDAAATAWAQPNQAILLTRPQHIPGIKVLDDLLRTAIHEHGWNARTTRSYRVYWSPPEAEGE